MNREFLPGYLLKCRDEITTLREICYQDGMWMEVIRDCIQ
jgi:hypothetical protein